MMFWQSSLERTSPLVRRWLGTAAASALFVVLSQARAASADCSVAPHAVLWTYPASGDTNVPTNAVLWALSTDWTTPTATLDGVPLPTPKEGEGVPLGVLAPQHDYVLRLEYRDAWSRPDAGSSVSEVRFRTGDGPAAQLPPVPVAGFSRSLGIDSAACPEILQGQHCYDMGQDTVFTFDVSDARAIGWQVGDTVWPARCGKPSLFVRDGWTVPCVDVRAIGSGGLRGEPTKFCLDARATTPTPVTNPWLDAGTVPASTNVSTPTASQTEASASTAMQPPHEGSCSVAAWPRNRPDLGFWLGVATLLGTLVSRRALRSTSRTHRAERPSAAWGARAEKSAQ